MHTPEGFAMRRDTRGFTLVEMLVVIAIIGVLAALLVPTVYRAVVAAQNSRIGQDIGALVQAIEAYKNKYGDYPPSGIYPTASPTIVERHMKSAFPRIHATEVAVPGLSPATALVFWLGGFSSDPQFPLSGPGGPLIVNRSVTPPTVTFRPLADRTNALFDFNPRQVNGAPGSETYRPPGQTEPYVYFDARGYTEDRNRNGTLDSGEDTNSNSSIDVAVFAGAQGFVRPYSQDPAGSWRFQNDKSFQVLSAGLDDHWGEFTGTNPAIAPAKRFPSGEGYRQVTVSKYDFDNLANFSNGKRFDNDQDFDN